MAWHLPLRVYSLALWHSRCCPYCIAGGTDTPVDAVSAAQLDFAIHSENPNNSSRVLSGTASLSLRIQSNGSTMTLVACGLSADPSVDPSLQFPSALDAHDPSSVLIRARQYPRAFAANTPQMPQTHITAVSCASVHTVLVIHSAPVDSLRLFRCGRSYYSVLSQNTISSPSPPNGVGAVLVCRCDCFHFSTYVSCAGAAVADLDDECVVCRALEARGQCVLGTADFVDQLALRVL